MQRRDLFVSTFAPRLGNGRDLRTYTLVRALASVRPLDLLYVPHGGGPSEDFTQIDGLELHEVVPSRGARRGVTALSIRARGWPTGVARSCSVEVRDAAERMAAIPGRGRVIAGDLSAMAMLMPSARRRPVVYNAHNIESSYGANPYIGRYHWMPVEALERRVLRAAAESWMVSRPDVEMALKLVPGIPVRYVPNVVDVAAITPIAPRAGGTRVLMVADYTYKPNRQSVEWFVERVLPRLWKQVPDARIRFVGRGLDLPGADPRIEVAGFVDDLRTAYDQADAVVVPLVEGAGTPLKFVEALAYAVPVVATPVAARGLEVVPDRHFLLAEDPAAFAQALVKLLSCGDPGMALRARELATAEYSVEALARHLADDDGVGRRPA